MHISITVRYFSSTKCGSRQASPCVCVRACVCVNVCILCVFLRTCPCPDPISIVYPGLVPGASQLRFVLDQQISLVKYFSVVTPPPTVKLQGKSETETQKRKEKYKLFLFLCFAPMSLLFLSFSFFFFTYLSLMASVNRKKMWLLLLSKEKHLVQQIPVVSQCAAHLGPKSSLSAPGVTLWGLPVKISRASVTSFFP